MLPLETSNREATQVPVWLVKEVTSGLYFFSRIIEPSGTLPLTASSTVLLLVFTSPVTATAGALITATESSGLWNIVS